MALTLATPAATPSERPTATPTATPPPRTAAPTAAPTDEEESKRTTNGDGALSPGLVAVGILVGFPHLARHRIG